MKNLQKDLARRRRREEANKFIEQRNILCSTSTSNVCRDERIVERGVWLVGWLVGCLRLNGPLRQYFILYRAVSQREGERKEK